MICSKYTWKVTPFKFDDHQLNELEKQTNLSPLVLKILIQRGYDNASKIHDFLEPAGNNIKDPFLLYDMQKAVTRIQQAIMEGQKIFIYGDYDADGITSTAVMYEVLEELGADVHYFVPDRFKDGYGPNLVEYKNLMQQGMQLLITVDNGVSGYDEIQYLQQHGIDVIVTDHHDLPAKLPPAYAIIHPRHPKGNYPFGGLAGVGVSFKVACALLEEIPEELIDLVAIGTIADLVPLIDENRDLVTYGLNALQMTSRVGLQSLYKVAKIKAATIDTETVGFMITPRLNALGRMKNASVGVKLLTTLDETEAQKLAKCAQELNQKRQQLVTQVTVAAETQLTHQRSHLVNIVIGKGWHEGILGIVASRLVEKSGRPTLVLTKQKDGILKGSGRSVKKFHMFQAFDKYHHLFESFGGHAMACGLSIKETKLPEFQKAADHEANMQGFDPSKKVELDVAAVINADEINLELITELKKLAPFGTANPQPLFWIKGINHPHIKVMGSNQQHFKIEFSNQEQLIGAVKFNAHEDITLLQQQPLDYLEIVGELTQNTWQGKTTPQIKLKDFTTLFQGDKAQIAVERVKILTKKLFDEDAIYGFFDPHIEKQVTKVVSHPLQTVLLPPQAKIIGDKLIIIDCPPTKMAIKELSSKVEVKNIIFKCYARHDISMQQLPTRHEFGKLYRFTSTHKNIYLKKDLEKLSRYLKIDKGSLIFMLRVFFEVGFVKMENGLLTGTPQDVHVDLTQTKTYKARVAQIKAQRLFIHTNTTELLRWLNSIL